MRLGDLDALREDLFIKFGNQLPNGLLEEIDNAPAVVIDEEIERQREEMYQSSKKLYATARMLGVERPQGKWEEYACSDERGCSLCGYMVRFYFEYRYCPNCGAKMEDDLNE